MKIECQEFYVRNAWTEDDFPSRLSREDGHQGCELYQDRMSWVDMRTRAVRLAGMAMWHWPLEIPGNSVETFCDCLDGQFQYTVIWPCMYYSLILYSQAEKNSWYLDYTLYDDNY